MRTLQTLAVALLAAQVLLPGRALAADVICTVPDDVVVQMAVLCETMRIERRIPDADWNMGDCASDFLQRGARLFYDQRNRSEARRSIDQEVRDKRDLFDTNFPSPSLAKASSCGDGTTELEFFEFCDDGNNIDGDGCDSGCQIE